MARAVRSAIVSCVLSMGACWALADGSAAAPATPPVAPSAPAVNTPAAGAKYFNIPVFGQLGTEVNPVALDVAFNEAEQANAKYVVMLFDTPGGDSAAVSAMVRTLSSHPKLQTIAFVRRATGAGALLAAACDKVYVYKTGIWGMVGQADCDEVEGCKTELAQVISSKHRNGQVMMALSDWGAELYLATVDGKPTVQNTRTPDSRVLKHPGSGFVLTPQDMVNCQVADAVCSTMGEVSHALGADDWVSCGDRGAEIVKSLRQTPKAIQVVVEARPGSDPVPEPGLQRDNAYFNAQAEQQQRAIAANRQSERRYYEERKRRDEERRDAENRDYLRWQNAVDQARKQRQMDAVGRPSRF